MRTIVLLMQRKPVAQSLIRNLEKVRGIRLFYERNYSKAGSIIAANNADVALIEVAETGKYGVEYCLSLCVGLRASNCKLLLLCPEQNELDVAVVVDAKRKGIIEDFVFYDTSIEYLESKLLAI